MSVCRIGKQRDQVFFLNWGGGEVILLLRYETVTHTNKFFTEHKK